jgi:hypothetical protein
MSYIFNSTNNRASVWVGFDEQRPLDSSSFSVVNDTADPIAVAGWIKDNSTEHIRVYYRGTQANPDSVISEVAWDDDVLGDDRKPHWRVKDNGIAV